MTKTDKDNHWIKQESNRWMKIYNHNLRGYIVQKHGVLSHEYECILQDKTGRTLETGVAVSLKSAKIYCDTMVINF